MYIDKVIWIVVVLLIGGFYLVRGRFQISRWSSASGWRARFLIGLIMFGLLFGIVSMDTDFDKAGLAIWGAIFLFVIIFGYLFAEPDQRKKHDRDLLRTLPRLIFFALICFVVVFQVGMYFF